MGSDGTMNFRRPIKTGLLVTAAALAHVTDGAAGAVFADRGVSVLLEGVAAAELGADAFWIG